MKKLSTVGLAGILAMSALAIASSAVAASGDVEVVDGVTYYVSASGSDSNSGTSPQTPFKTLDKVNTLTLNAGDRILLKRGDTFAGQHLCISGDADFKFNDGSGCAVQENSDGAPLIISAYGDGSAKPVIAANGAGTWKLDYGLTLGHSQHYLAQDAVSSAVMLKDAQNIEITDLEITNERVEDAAGLENGCAYNDNCALDRTGVAGIAQDKGTLDHVVLKDLYVHDVEGNVYNKHSLNGAIYFSAFIATSDMLPKSERTEASFVPALTKPKAGYPRYNDLQIIDNRVEDSGRWGIAGVYSAYGSAALDSIAEIPDADIVKYGSTNVVMSGNFIKNIGGDALTAMYAYKPVIEHNVATDIATQMNDQDYLWKHDGNNGNGKKVVNDKKFEKQGGRVAASVWPWKSKDAVFRFNEAYNTLNADKGNGDGMPWDADSGDGTLYEYNYSANNSGGTVMFCGDQAANSTFRFNIAQNDKMGALSPTYWGNNNYDNVYPNAHVYNNTFYMGEGASVLHPAQGQQGTMKVENNIFYNATSNPRQETWTVSSMTWDPKVPDGTLKVSYSHNLYYNFANTPTSDAKAVRVTAGDGVMADPGKGPSAAASDMQARNHYFPSLSFDQADAKRSEFDGYKLNGSSPAIGKGKAITDMNGFALATDFFGREANTTDIGAVSTDNEPPAYEASEAALVSTYYYVTKDGTKTTNPVTSSKNGDKAAYENGDVIHVPSTDKSPSTVDAVIANITFKGDKVSVVDAAGAEQALTTHINSVNGAKLKITGANNTVLEFPIEIDNTYNWRDDYTYDVQGNVWFAQKQKGLNGDWENISTSDQKWPNWVYEQYYGPGIDANTLNPDDRSAMHGLLSDSPKSEGATAMAWRAPKTGAIKFQVLPKDTVNNRPAEPYLRQGDATGGKVTIKLIVNGIEKRSLELAKKNVRPSVDFDFTAIGEWALYVKRGDYVRVVAESTGTPQQESIHVTPIITYFDRNIDTTVTPVTAASESLTSGGTNVGSEPTPEPEPGSTSDEPTYVEGKAPRFTLVRDEDGTVTGKVTLPHVDGVSYTVNDSSATEGLGAGKVTIKAKAQQGYKFGESATTEWTFIVPAMPTFNPATGELTVPTVEGVTYDEASQTIQPGQTIQVLATPAQGSSFGATKSVSWTFTANKAHVQPSSDPSDSDPSDSNPSDSDGSRDVTPSTDKNDAAKPRLSHTGSNTMWAMLVSLTLIAGGVAFVTQRRQA